MIFLLALIGAVTIAVVLYTAMNRRGAPGHGPAPRRMLAPDDDPEFLRGLDKRKPDEDD